MSVELDSGKLKRVVENALISRLVIWQKGHVDRAVATYLSDAVVEAIWEAALIAKEDTVENGILAGVRMIHSWQDERTDGE